MSNSENLSMRLHRTSWPLLIQFASMAFIAVLDWAGQH